MARSKRWTIPFMSKKGIICRVDIYDEDYSGDVIELSLNNADAPGIPAAEPFVYQEDDSDDLLRVVRTKTAYLRMVELTYGGLVDLYPETNTQHYVEFYYNNVLNYTGYMKAQAFDNQWTAAPRELEFPIVSPLGVTEGMYFDKSDNADFRNLGAMLYEAIVGMDAGITRVVFPDPHVNNVTKKTYAAFKMYMSSTVILPEDGDYGYTNTAEDLFTSISYYDFIEGICNCFGLIAHDLAGLLVFSRFDYEGKYALIPWQQLTDTSNRTVLDETGATVENLENTTSIAGAEHSESVVMPVGKIDISYGGSLFNSYSLPWEHCTRMAGTILLPDYSIVLNTPLNNDISCDNLTNIYYIGSNGRMSHAGEMFAALGKDSLAEMVLIQTGDGWNSGTPTILKTIIYDRPQGMFYVNFDAAYGSSVEELNCPAGTGPTIHVWIKCGSKYYSQTYGWSTTAASIDVSYQSDTCEVFVRNEPPRGYPIEIWLTSDLQYYNTSYIYALQNFTVNLGDSQAYEYIYGRGSNSKKIYGGASQQNGSVSTLFSTDKLNTHLLSIRDSASVSYPSSPTYDYMFLAQNRLQVTVKGSLSDYYYIKKFSYWIDGWRWRIIAVSFNPWDDTYTLTLHRSSTIED